MASETPEQDPALHNVAGSATSDAAEQIGYLCVYSRSDPAIPNVPLLRGTNPLGTLMIESGMMPVFAKMADVLGPAGEGLMTVMPIEMIGVEVHEELHRFDIEGQAPDPQRGVRAGNRVGEHIAAVTMRWMIAPDDFVPALDKVPPPTALDMNRSQKFVMLGGRMTFRDNAQSGLRGFGSGRTFPATIRGKSQLRIAAIVNVIEGFGNLKGLSGTIVVNGYVQPPKGLFINFVARFIDPSGQLRSAVALNPIQPIPEPDPSTTFLAFVGEPQVSGPAGPVATAATERLRLVHSGFDLGASHLEGLRTFVEQGPVVGGVSATRAIGASDGAVTHFTTHDGVFTFEDASGRPIGTLRVNIVEGKIFRDSAAGQPVERVAGFGPLLGGTGVFDGAIGMMTMNAGAGVSSLYVIRVSDPDGRYRAAFETARAVAGNAGASAGTDPAAAPPALSAADRQIVAEVDRTIGRGVEVKNWFETVDARSAFAERFDVVRQFSTDVRSFGFFDEAPAGGRREPVMGLVQEMVFDRERHAPGGTELRDEFREFLLRYFMRVSHGRKPVFAADDRPAPAAYLRPLSWLPSKDDARVGFGYRQLLYRLRGSGEVGKFAKDEQCAIIDLREIGTKYDWIVAKVSIFDFNLAMSPLGGDSMKLLYPLKEEAYVVIGPQFITVDERPDDDIVGRYGFGYAFLPYADERGVIAYGPGHFLTAVQTFDFSVRKSGEIDARAVFIVNRPDQIMKIDVDPIGWGFKMADMMTMNMASRVFAPVKAVSERLPLRVTGVDPVSAYITAANIATAGFAGKQLGISKEQLEKRMLVQHFMQHYDMLLHSLSVWRSISTWADPDTLPEFCHRGMEM
jgi:hypothetical protein